MIATARERARARAEIERMVHEEIVLRPARRAAAFCAIVVLALGASGLAAGGEHGSAPGLEIRAEIVR